MSDIGFDKAPAHYDGERETIDKIRDMLEHDIYFAFFCLGTAMKYQCRQGRKAAPTLWYRLLALLRIVPSASALRAEDRAKSRFYTQMARHVADPGVFQDPRAGRPGFVSYVRKHPEDAH